MMLKLRTPRDDGFDELLRSCREAEFTYKEIGGTQGTLPANFSHGHKATIVGQGASDFRQGVELLSHWQQFELAWVRASAFTPVDEGVGMLVIARIFGVTTINPCRVVYSIAEEDSRRALFAYACGTLAGHDVQGEERFQLEWDKTTDLVEFRIDSFSRPDSWLAKLFAPLARHKQQQFRRESSQRIQELLAKGRQLPKPKSTHA